MLADPTQAYNRATLTKTLADIWPGDPERRLIATIIYNAVRDVMHGSPALVVDARRYLKGRNFEIDCGWLGLDPQRIRALLERDEKEMNQLIPPEKARSLHAEFMADRRATIKGLAEKNHVSAATLSRAFRREGLPTSRPRKTTPMIVGAAPLQVGPVESPAETLRELQTLLRDFRGRTTGSVRIQVDFSLEVQL